MMQDEICEVTAMMVESPIQDRETEAFWQERARLLRVVAHPVRLMILDKLSGKPHCVKHLNSLIPIPQPHLSQHMAALRKAELVACHSCGPVRCYYLLRPTLVKKLLELLSRAHPPQTRQAPAVVREARRGWEEDLGEECHEADS